jgi:hypothetical protein
MTWRDRIVKDKIQKQKLRVASHWKNRIKPEGPKVIHGKNGTDFVFADHKEEISKILKAHVSEFKPELLSELSSLIKNQIAQIKPKAGENGKDSNRFHLVSSLDDAFGQNDDLALMEKTFDLFIKKDGEWILKGSLRSKSNAMSIGGVSPQFVTQAINEALANIGGSTSYIVREASADYDITNEDMLICLGTFAFNVNLNISKTGPVHIKNVTNQAITAVGTVRIGTNDDGTPITDTGFICPPRSDFWFTFKEGYFYVS